MGKKNKTKKAFKKPTIGELMQGWKPDKDRFRDERGRFITQGLFIEDRYNADLAVYSLGPVHKMHKGILYPSLKQLYLEMADVKEYTFATTYLADWPHWLRIAKNVIMGRHIADWREELELMMESEAMLAMMALVGADNYQAAKFVVEKGWEKKKRGRPSKEEVAGALAKEAAAEKEYEEDFKLLKLVPKG